MVVKAKRQITPHDVDQLLAQAVVSRHIHHNKHPEENPLIPDLGVSAVNGEMMAVPV